MIFDPVIAVEDTDEKPTYFASVYNEELTFKKITTKSGKEYAWYSIKEIGDTWYSVEDRSNLPDTVYNIVIIHNRQNKPMVDVTKGPMSNLRQEVNLWKNRNQPWTVDE